MSHHKYIFDQGEFIRDFDGMYRDFEDPHGQKLSSNNLSHKIYLKILQEVIKNKRGNKWYDFGCGLGYFTKKIGESFDKVSITGIDISKSVIDKINNNSNNYLCGDIKDELFIQKLDNADIISFFETLYYFKSDEILLVKENIDKILKNDGFLIITYHLPKEMNYGDYINKLTDLENLFENYKLVYGSDFIDNYSKIYDGHSFGRHLFTIFQKI